MSTNRSPLRFGDKLENLFASADNPRRFSYFVRDGYRNSRINGGKFIEVTDGNGDFWTFSDDAKSAEHIRKIADSTLCG